MDSGNLLRLSKPQLAEDEINLVRSHDREGELPSYDEGTITKHCFLGGLVLVWLCSAACIIAGIVAFAQPTTYMAHNSNHTQTASAQLEPGMAVLTGSGDSYAFIATVLVTLCTEVVGFGHTVALRWAVQKEGRLHWITNLRLFTTSRISAATGAFSNILYLITLALAYTAASQLFLPTVLSAGDDPFTGAIELRTVGNGTALLVLGMCLLVQAILVTWTISATRSYVKTWTSNPLSILLACISGPAGLKPIAQGPRWSSVTPTATRLAQRKIQGNSFDLASSTRSTPQARQPSLLATRKKATLLALSIVTALPILILTWAAIVLSAWHRSATAESWAEFGDISSKLKNVGAYLFGEGSWANVPALNFWPQLSGIGDIMPTASTMMSFVYLLVTCAIQSCVTLALHCVELIVNANRDQRFWERAATHLKRKRFGRGSSEHPESGWTHALSARTAGAELKMPIMRSLLINPPDPILAAMKPVTHWVFNRAILPVSYIRAVSSGDPTKADLWKNEGMVVFLFGLPVVLLAALTILLAVYVWLHAGRRPSGPQPSAFGHVQTLAELIDDWGDGERLFWGDKGTASDGEIRYAGTSSARTGVGLIQQQAEYT